MIKRFAIIAGQALNVTVAQDAATLKSAGAVWLDESNASQQEVIDRLQGLIVANVEAVRPAIRQQLGLPPL